jgi:3-oxoacyl-[acyl-carrier-protein] synthase II
MKPRIVITGLGAITPLGNNIRQTWTAVANGNSGIGRITKFDAAAFPCRVAGEIKNFDPRQFMSAKEALKTDPFVQYALAAALMAVADSGLVLASHSVHRIGVLIGSGRGGVATCENNMTAYLAAGPKAVSPFYTPMSPVSMAAGFASMKLRTKGPCLDVSTACCSGTHALGEAMKIIQRGDADIMIAGGSEAPITPLTLAGFCKARALSLRNDEPAKASRPFDRDRDGFVLSEGACVLILEEAGHAEKRGARIYAELAGYGLASEAYHLTRPDPSGETPAHTMRLALSDAGMMPEEIDYINAHGTSTKQNDAVETTSIKKAFGRHAYMLAVSSTKSSLGHMLGAGGAVEAAVCTLAISEGAIPPTINLEHSDPECDLNYVPNVMQKKELRAALSNSLGFGGFSASLVFKRFIRDSR